MCPQSWGTPDFARLILVLDGSLLFCDFLPGHRQLSASREKPSNGTKVHIRPMRLADMPHENSSDSDSLDLWTVLAVAPCQAWFRQELTYLPPPTE